MIRAAFYSFLKIYCRLALRFYFRKWQVHGAENVPEGSVIFVPNHQNAFLDAVLVACSSKKNPWFLTRSDVFKNSFASRVLSLLRMIPVYRFRDGFASLRNNETVIASCVRKIESGESLLIFPEGNHGSKFQLRSLQKGVARIVAGVSEKAGISIVPVGIQYDSYHRFRSRVLVNFGKPVVLKKITDPSEFANTLLRDVETALKPLMLHIDDVMYEEKIQYLHKRRIRKRDLVEQLHSDQQILQQFPEGEALPQVKVEENLLGHAFRLFVYLNLLVPSRMLRHLLLSKIPDKQFNGSVKFAAGMFLVPIFTVLQGGILFWISGSMALAIFYLISVPVAILLRK